MQYRELEIDERAKVDEFYQLTAYRRPVSSEDKVYIAEENSEIYGAVRIELRENVQVLRDMYIHPEHTLKGIGSQLLFSVEPCLSKTESYCIPLDYLVVFYGKIGFKHIEPHQVPEFLSKRIESYFEEGKKVIIMHRTKGKNA